MRLENTTPIAPMLNGTPRIELGEMVRSEEPVHSGFKLSRPVVVAGLGRVLKFEGQ